MLRRFFASVLATVRSILKPRPVVADARGKQGDPDEGAVGAGVTVPIKPSPPVLVGKEAKPIPAGNNSDEAAEGPRLAA